MSPIIGNHKTFWYIHFPFYIAEKSATLLDFFITTAIVDIVFRGNYNNCLKTYYESGHSAVEIILNSGSVESRPILECFNYAKMDVDSFNKSLEELLLSFLLPIDHNVSIHQIIQELIKISEDEYWTDVFKNIRMYNRTYKKSNPWRVFSAGRKSILL